MKPIFSHENNFKFHKMRFALLFLSLLFISLESIAQTTLVKVIFTVEDFDTRKGMPGALVQIRQTASTQPTLADGKVTFNNVPVGEIEYFIMKEGYQFETGRVNVSTDEKTNIFRISISKIDDKKILVTGEVTDSEGRDLKDALVEVKIADQVRTVTTDASGNYSADIAPSSKFPTSSMRIEVKKGDCKKTETVDIPRTNVVYKDFKLDCKNNPIEGKPNTNGNNQTGTTSSSQKMTKGYLTFELISSIQSGETVECTIKIISKDRDIDILMFRQKVKIVTQNGNEFEVAQIRLGDKISQGNAWTPVTKGLVEGIPINCVLVFNGVKENVSQIPKFETHFHTPDLDWFQLIFRNVKL